MLIGMRSLVAAVFLAGSCGVVLVDCPIPQSMDARPPAMTPWASVGGCGATTPTPEPQSSHSVKPLVIVVVIVAAATVAGVTTVIAGCRAKRRHALGG